MAHRELVQLERRPRLDRRDADATYPVVAGGRTPPPLVAFIRALDAQWISKCTFLDELFSDEADASVAVMTQVVRDVHLRCDADRVVPAIVDAFGSNGALTRVELEAAFEAATREAPETVDSATDTISRAIEEFTIAASPRGVDGFDRRVDEFAVHPHEYNGLLAIVAHNNTKPAMKQFIEETLDIVSLFPLVTTRSTGTVLERVFGLQVKHKTTSGPLGGDQEIGSMITRGEVDGVLFFRDPLSAHPHDDDIKALMRVCDVHCIPTATNPATGRAVLEYLKSLAASRSRDIRQGEKTEKVVERRRSKTDSAIVQKYKNDQAIVVDKVAAGGK
mmetsp:Transcript_11205/g.33825  ORF Transcript_11205/g.33825 Transcript_11205/m.33825 type:complete len:333 (+) Transcript_11205:244-1242(+)